MAEIRAAGADWHGAPVPGTALVLAGPGAEPVRSPDLLAQAHVSAVQPPPGGATAPSRASLQADLLAANDRCRRLADQVRVLEHRLSAELGQQVWQRTGIGTPTDIDGLQARILDLEQQNLDLKIQLDERTDELEAARSANRELTKTLNQPGRTP